MRTLSISLVATLAILAVARVEHVGAAQVRTLTAEAPRKATEAQQSAAVTTCDEGASESDCTVTVTVRLDSSPTGDIEGDYFDCRVERVTPEVIAVRGGATLKWVIEPKQNSAKPLFQFFRTGPTDTHGGIAINVSGPNEFDESKFAKKRSELTRVVATSLPGGMAYSYNVRVTHRKSATLPARICAPFDPIIISRP
jgi:hypothetical protein